MCVICGTLELRRFVAPAIRSFLWAGFVFGGQA